MHELGIQGEARKRQKRNLFALMLLIRRSTSVYEHIANTNQVLSLASLHVHGLCVSDMPGLKKRSVHF